MAKIYILGDVETTGLKSTEERMTEIALIKCNEDFEIISTYETLINPERVITAKITELTGITEEMVENERKYDEVIPDVKKYWFEDTNEDDEIIFIAHNAPFDCGFINQAFVDILGEEQFISKWIDTVSIARELYPFWRNHKLDTCADKFGIVNENHHRALNDTMVLLQIAKRIIPEFEQDGLNPINFRTAKKLHYKN